MNAPASELETPPSSAGDPPAAPPPDAPDEVPAADVAPPGPAEELVAFARALGHSVHAELALSFAAWVRASVLGVVTLVALVLAWGATMVALTLALVAWLDSAAWAFTVLAAAHGAAAAIAWNRRLAWQRRIGFPRTRAAIATVAGKRESPP